MGLFHPSTGWEGWGEKKMEKHTASFLLLAPLPECPAHP